ETGSSSNRVALHKNDSRDGFCVGRELSDPLFDAVIEDSELVPGQTTDYFTTAVRNDDIEVHQIDVNTLTPTCFKQEGYRCKGDNEPSHVREMLAEPIPIHHQLS